MEKTPLNRAAPVTQQRYTPDEVAILASIAPSPVRSRDLAAMFPDRSIGALKKRLADERRRMGIAPRYCRGRIMTESRTMLDPDDPGIDDAWEWEECIRMARGSDALLAAMQRLAA